MLPFETLILIIRSIGGNAPDYFTVLRESKQTVEAVAVVRPILRWYRRRARFHSVLVQKRPVAHNNSAEHCAPANPDSAFWFAIRFQVLSCCLVLAVPVTDTVASTVTTSS